MGAGDLQELTAKNRQSKSVQSGQISGASCRECLQKTFFRRKIRRYSNEYKRHRPIFRKKSTTGLGKYVDQLRVETDNKEIRKKAKKLCKLLQEETAVKLAAVKCCATGFSSSQYLRAISSAEIEAAPKKERKKRQKIATTYSEADIDHPELFQTLREWRAEKAKEDRGSPFSYSASEDPDPDCRQPAGYA